MEGSKDSKHTPHAWLAGRVWVFTNLWGGELLKELGGGLLTPSQRTNSLISLLTRKIN